MRRRTPYRVLMEGRPDPSDPQGSALMEARPDGSCDQRVLDEQLAPRL